MGYRLYLPQARARATWRLVDLCRIIWERFGVRYDESGLGKLLHRLDLSWQTPWPRHAETDPAAQERFKKRASRAPSRKSQPTTPRLSGSRSGFRCYGGGHRLG
ncbi:helix-turn-helix domain-containing protein [Paeniroseomonas aquatica]|uniref:helix-turn-helix domain-containing protein n=1 Tax=Paeniroseomonas aquatica TaxID=373043 RepID=UPI00338FBED6